MIKLNAKQLRETAPDNARPEKIKRNEISIIIDNVLDTYNIGAIFRLADAVAAEKVYLCGKTTTPPDHRIQKASVGTWAWVPWEYMETAEAAVEKIKSKKKNTQIIALEQHPRSTPFNKINYTFPVAFIVGHETEGVSKEALEKADCISEIPLFGVNRSLNVMVSLAIVMFWAIGNNPEF